MTDEPAPTNPNETLERCGTLTTVALTVATVAPVVPMVKTSFEAGGKVHDLLHPPKPESPIWVPDGAKTD